MTTTRLLRRLSKSIVRTGFAAPALGGGADAPVATTEAPVNSQPRMRHAAQREADARQAQARFLIGLNA